MSQKPTDGDNLDSHLYFDFDFDSISSPGEDEIFFAVQKELKYDVDFELARRMDELLDPIAKQMIYISTEINKLKNVISGQHPNKPNKLKYKTAAALFWGEDGRVNKDAELDIESAYVKPFVPNMEPLTYTICVTDDMGNEVESAGDNSFIEYLDFLANSHHEDDTPRENNIEQLSKKLK